MFRRIIHPFLVDVDFSDEDLPLRWWPMGRRGRIIIDPQRSFGRPIVADKGVPTCVLSQAYEVERSTKVVAKWYEVSPRAVRDSVEFEGRLVA